MNTMYYEMLTWTIIPTVSIVFMSTQTTQISGRRPQRFTTSRAGGYGCVLWSSFCPLIGSAISGFTT